MQKGNPFNQATCAVAAILDFIHDKMNAGTRSQKNERNKFGNSGSSKIKVTLVRQLDGILSLQDQGVRYQVAPTTIKQRFQLALFAGVHEENCLVWRTEKAKLHKKITSYLSPIEIADKRFRRDPVHKECTKTVIKILKKDFAGNDVGRKHKNKNTKTITAKRLR